VLDNENERGLSEGSFLSKVVHVREEDLSKDVVEAKKLQLGWQVRIDAVLSHEFMMFDVISLEVNGCFLFFLRSLKERNQP
jgi:hypothetical protein